MKTLKIFVLAAVLGGLPALAGQGLLDHSYRQSGKPRQPRS